MKKLIYNQVYFAIFTPVMLGNNMSAADSVSIVVYKKVFQQHEPLGEDVRVILIGELKRKQRTLEIETRATISGTVMGVDVMTSIDELSGHKDIVNLLIEKKSEFFNLIFGEAYQRAIETDASKW